MLACAAGKDVYVEKPLTPVRPRGPVDDRRGPAAQARRAGRHAAALRAALPAGARADPRRAHRHRSSRCGWRSYRNIMPGFGTPADGDPPPELDWDLWLGPAPQRPYNPNRGLYHFRWFWDYSGGQMTNLGAALARHRPLVPRRCDGPTAVTSAGGRFGLARQRRDARHAGRPLRVSRLHGRLVAPRGSARAEPPATGAGVLRHQGEPGDLAAAASSSRPTATSPPENAVPQFAGAHPVGGPAAHDGAGPRRSSGPKPSRTDSGDERDQFRRHARNFLDCVKSRRDADLGPGERPPRRRPPATWPTSRCGWAASSAGTRRKETIVGDAEAARLLERPVPCALGRRAEEPAEVG